VTVRLLKGRLDLCAINTATLGHKLPIEMMVDEIARYGFGGICPWRRDLDGRDAGSTARRIREAGLKVSGYCRSTSLTAPSRNAFDANIEDNRRAIDQAAVLGAACFVMVVGSLPAGSRDLEGARAQVAEGIAILHERARKVGVRLALEPLHPMYANDRSCLNTLEQAVNLAESIEPDAGVEPSLGLAVDAYHVWWDPNLTQEIGRAGATNRIFAYHVCDWLVPTRDMLVDRGMMGDGVIDLQGLRKRVEEAGYNDLVEVEIFSRENWWKRSAEETLSVCSERLQSIC
jgi:sugar phosphate isomerase/epimerase